LRVAIVIILEIGISLVFCPVFPGKSGYVAKLRRDVEKLEIFKLFASSLAVWRF
jgi:hypothetical protein